MFRILLGVGVGGDYPMSASITSDRANLRKRGTMLAYIFSNQGWGSLLGSLITIIVLAIYRHVIEEEGKISKVDGVWRIVVGVSLIPGFATLYQRLTLPESVRFKASQKLTNATSDAEKGDAIAALKMAQAADGIQSANADYPSVNISKTSVETSSSSVTATDAEEAPSSNAHFKEFIIYFSEWRHAKILIGTCVCWFLLDIAFYGINLNQNVVLQEIGYDGKSGTAWERIFKISTGNIIITVLGFVPGYWVSVFTIEYMGRKWIQIQGFLLAALFLGVLAGKFESLSTAGFIVCFAFLQFFFNWGANTTAYILGLSSILTTMLFAKETPFTIAIPEERLSLLQQKLALTTFPDELEEAGWHYGVPLADIKRLVNYWKDGFDWRKHEAALNAELPQYTRDIEVEGYGTLNIHYVHKRSDVKAAIPLLFVHGWPGSFLEVRKMLPLLVQQAASGDHPSFHVVALDLPGFGFSSAPSKRGFDLPQYAEVAHKLMISLGYHEYVTQGGDFGFVITRKMAEKYGPKHVKAWHTNFPISRRFGPNGLYLLDRALSYLPFYSYSQRQLEGFKRTAWFGRWGSGYFAEQTTRPQTLGYNLADSPVGLLAWIYEKLVEWSDGYQWSDDEVLTWISIYWFSRAGPTASIRIYYETFGGTRGITIDPFHEVIHTKALVGYSHFPQEIVQLPRRWTRVPNLVYEAEHDKGGHFAAYEQCEALADDLRKMFGKGGGAFGVVNGKHGYDN
ncbi:hypothetical protein H0H93_005897 [Arthromyces matolae]|nr:hypothetical protein H0H93_005897 [Arthromyces matolae]